MKTLLLIDANALIHRAFHALPPLTTPDGQPIGAVYGLANTLLKILKNQKPDFIAAAFDRPEPTFRKQEFPEYKAHRPKAADELIAQIIKAHELMKKFEIKIFEKPGYEADDIIGTLVQKFKNKKDLKIIILTGDLDTLQLIEGEKIVVQTPQKGVSETVIYDEAAVIKRFGLGPERLSDYKALVGDPSDNIPGVPGIGPKTAEKILKEHRSLELLYKKIKPIDPLTEKLLTYQRQAFLSKKLATIDRAVPLEIELNDLSYKNLSPKNLIQYFTELGFQSLIQRLLNQGQLFDQQKNFPETTLPSHILFVPSTQFAMSHPKEMAESDKLKIALGWKNIFKELDRNQQKMSDPIFDLEIAGWLLDPDQKKFSPEALARRFLHREPENNNEALMRDLFALFQQKIKEYNLTRVFETIEMPLIRTLATIETWGITINTARLKTLEKKIAKELKELAEQIYKEAGAVFNINSPQQVAEVIFEKLKIKSVKIKKTTTGKRSTAEDILFELKNQHPIIELLLSYRESFKVKSTYVSPFRKMTAKTNKIHSTFIQTGTATGRLSSARPNLQNIPQESKWAIPLRQIFEADSGKSFLSFDYSQLELRLLAHVADEQKLQEAFAHDLDAHQMTAAQVFNVPFEKVDPQMRRIGKTLNFGVIYGMGARAFSKTSGLPLDEAERFVKEYFNDFSKIREWQEKTKSEAKTFGFVKNLNGRRRWFLNAYTSEKVAAYEMERAAINMPIQSLGADIIKLAMIKCFEIMKNEGWLDSKARLLLTIHDELLFEISDDILKKAKNILRNVMENIYPLNVPLKVEVKAGKNWGEMQKYE